MGDITVFVRWRDTPNRAYSEPCVCSGSQCGNNATTLFFATTAGSIGCSSWAMQQMHGLVRMTKSKKDWRQLHTCAHEQDKQVRVNYRTTSENSSDQGSQSSPCSGALACFKSLHTLLGLCRVYRDVDSLVVKICKLIHLWHVREILGHLDKQPLTCFPDVDVLCALSDESNLSLYPSHVQSWTPSTSSHSGKTLWHHVNKEVSKLSAFCPGHNTLHVGTAANWFFDSKFNHSPLRFTFVRCGQHVTKNICRFSFEQEQRRTVNIMNLNVSALPVDSYLIGHFSTMNLADRHDWSRFAPTWWCSLLWSSCFVTFVFDFWTSP